MVGMCVTDHVALRAEAESPRSAVSWQRASKLLALFSAGAGLSGFEWVKALGFRESVGAAPCLAEQEAETPVVWIAMRCPLTQWLWAPPPLPSAAFHIGTSHRGPALLEAPSLAF